jgi:hypothetical protein
MAELTKTEKSERRKRFWGVQSVRLNRGKVHYTTLNGILTLAIFVRSYGLPDSTLLFLIPAAVGGMWLVGYLDEKHGIYKMENAFSARINPVFREILDNTREIKDSIRARKKI